MICSALRQALAFSPKPVTRTRIARTISVGFTSKATTPSLFATANDDFIEKHEFVLKQAGISEKLRSGASLTSENDFLKHQAQTFDEMAPVFAKKETIPEHLLHVYQTLAFKILEVLINERQAASGVNEDQDFLRPYQILDVACGTGALWPFLLEKATAMNMTLLIQGLDLSPRMVECAKEHAASLLTPDSSHRIEVVCSDIMEYHGAPVESEEQNETTTYTSYDAVICNACWANFYSPQAILQHVTTNLLQSHKSAKGQTFGRLFVTHPLGQDFIKELHDADPQTVPHLLPEKWYFSDFIRVPLQLEEFVPEQVDVRPFMPEEQNTDEFSTIKPFYFAALRRVRHYLLPHVWRFRGPVARGYGRGGKKLGFPTANLVASIFFQNALQELEAGVYIGWASVEDSSNEKVVVHRAVVNVGYSPTFEGQENPEKIIEAHLMPEEGISLSDFYGETMRLELLAYLRAEEKFASFPDLITQINADVADAKDALEAHPVLRQARADSFFLKPDWTAKNQDSEEESGSSWERKDMKEFLEKYE
eukprot:CAMPEP_0198141934 /NCGR_PEP_ID=MMETSP1443-20131203/4848_1 /TAXON_ID=186043 /ORGANISM="Entomoneis sp., Strain CCMP2396" /LENGTH=536 /DNA_ID=CAMNT_0043804823 /DNA_START=109 /DNA_END=1719 /DNA_ORIENTATION=-